MFARRSESHPATALLICQEEHRMSTDFALPAPRGHAAPVLRAPAQEAILDAERVAEVPAAPSATVSKLARASVGTALFGLALRSAAEKVTPDWGHLGWAGALPAAVLLSWGVCLPALYILWAAKQREVGIAHCMSATAEAIATTGMTLLALCPVWLAYAHLVGGPPNAYFHVMLGAVAFLAFAGVRGTAVLLGALRLQKRAALHLAAWTLLYGMVGLQAAWMLRPFVGTPTDTSGKLALFRPLDRSAFDATWNLFGSNVNSLTGQRTLRQAYPFSRDRGE